jgi:hypothetical protein
MSDQTENEKTIAALSAQVADLNSKLLNYTATTHAYNKINNVLLMQVLSKVENRDLEEIRSNVDKYIAQFSEDFVKKNS